VHRVIAASMVFLALGFAAQTRVYGSVFVDLQARLIQEGFEEEFIRGVYESPSVRFEPRPVLSYFTIRESRLNYNQFLEPSSVQLCREYVDRHRETLEAVEKRTHVPPALLAALFMVETRLGTYTGRFNVLNILSSLSVSHHPETMKDLFDQLKPEEREQTTFEDFQSFCARKSDWAYKELVAFLGYTRAVNSTPHDIQGSLAGAIGIPQFIPSNVLRYGKDGDGDGKVDLFSHEDALHSAAHILTACGWKKDMGRAERRKALLCYNRSGPYADTILELARRVAGEPAVEP